MSAAATPWRRIDPRSIVVGSIPHLITTWLTFLLIRESFSFDEWFVREYLCPAATVVAAAGVIHQIVRRATTFYALEERTVRLRSGWLLRHRTAVDRHRVRTVVLHSGVLARPLGLTRILLGTGETRRDAAVILAWVPTAVAGQLRAQLLEHAGPVGGRCGMLARGRPSWALWAPFTALSVSLWAGSYAVAYQLFLAWFGWWRTTQWLITEQVDPLTVLRVLVVVPVVIGVLGAVLVYLEHWWGFRLERTPRGTLETRYGLIARRSVSLQESRLRGVEFVQPLLPRILHRARLVAVTTGAGSQRTLLRQLPAARRRTLLPLGPAAQAARTASAVLDREVDLADLWGHPVQARRKRYRWAVLSTAAVLLVIWAVFREPLQNQVGTFILAGLALVASALVIAEDNYRSLGHRLDPCLLLLRNGTVRRTTTVSQRRTVIGWVFRQSWFQYRLGLVTAVASTAAGSGSYWLHDAGAAGAVRLARDITPELIEPHLLSQDPAPPGEVPAAGSTIGSWLVFTLVLVVAVTSWWTSRRRKKPDERA
ncbi:PH domain-containing protein [Kocuria himachalensis]